MCDSCNKLVKFHTRILPFLGNYVRKTWTCRMNKEEQMWKEGKIDVTFYCLACLASYHNVDESEAAQRFLRNEISYRLSRSQNWKSD